MVPPPALTPVREHLAQTSHRLTLPRAHLIRMNRVLRGDLLQRPVAPCRKRSRPCEKSKSWVADPAASRLEHGGGLATAAPISRGVGRVGRVRDCCDHLTARFGLVVALEAGEIGVQPAAAAIIAGSPARLIARRML